MIEATLFLRLLLLVLCVFHFLFVLFNLNFKILFLDLKKNTLKFALKTRLKVVYLIDQIQCRF